MCLHVFVKVFYVFVKVVVKEINKGKEWGQNTLWWSLRCFTETYWTYHHCLAIYNIISLPPSLLSLLTETITKVSWGSMKHVIEYPFGMCYHLALFLFTKKDNEELVGKAGQRISIGAYHCFLRHQWPHDQRLGTLARWLPYLTVPWQMLKSSREISICQQNS